MPTYGKENFKESNVNYLNKDFTALKTSLMNYAKLNYGKFDTGFDKDNFNSFKVWKKNNEIVIYKRMININNIWDEEIFISNEKYEEPLMVERSRENKIVFYENEN